jgi:hypothetical protein
MLAASNKLKNDGPYAQGRFPLSDVARMLETGQRAAGGELTRSSVLELVRKEA